MGQASGSIRQGSSGGRRHHCFPSRTGQRGPAGIALSRMRQSRAPRTRHESADASRSSGSMGASRQDARLRRPYDSACGARATGSARVRAAVRRNSSMKIYLIAPKNPESFWTFDRILPSLNKKCVFPEPVAADRRRPHAAGARGRSLRRERRADRLRHGRGHRRPDRLRRPREAHLRDRRGVPPPRQVRGRRRPVRLALPRAAARPRRRRLRRRGRVHVAAVSRGLRGRELETGVPAAREAEHARLAAAALRPAEARPVPDHDHPVRARLPLPVRVLRHHRDVRPAAAHQDRRTGDGRGRRDPPARPPAHLRRRRQLHREQEGGQGAAARAGRLAGEQRLPDRAHDRGHAQRRAGRRAARS